MKEVCAIRLKDCWIVTKISQFNFEISLGFEVAVSEIAKSTVAVTGKLIVRTIHKLADMKGASHCFKAL